MSRLSRLACLLIAAGCGGAAAEPTPASCSVEILNDEYGPDVAWITREEDHADDGRALEIRLYFDEYGADVVYLRWVFTYDGDLLDEITVFNHEYAENTPWLVARYENVPASSTSGCPTDFALPGLD